jgi:hypothetical protein
MPNRVLLFCFHCRSDDPADSSWWIPVPLRLPVRACCLACMVADTSLPLLQGYMRLAAAALCRVRSERTARGQARLLRLCSELRVSLLCCPAGCEQF